MLKVFEEFCILHEIWCEHTVCNCPQENNVAERANCVVSEGNTAMLNKSDLPHQFLKRGSQLFCACSQLLPHL